jgi:hypothetical protein
MTDTSLFSPEHVQLLGLIVLPLSSGILYIIWQTAQMKLKVDQMWSWYSNDAHELTGYKPGDEKKKK